MIKDALEYIVEMKKPNITEIGGQTYSDKKLEIVPSPVHLKPYRTFDEIDQPESDFIFRIKSDKFDGITCALFSADGGAWITEAKQRIKEYLRNELSDLIEKGKIIILA